MTLSTIHKSHAAFALALLSLGLSQTGCPKKNDDAGNLGRPQGSAAPSKASELQERGEGEEDENAKGDEDQEDEEDANDNENGKKKDEGF